MTCISPFSEGRINKLTSPKSHGCHLYGVRCGIEKRGHGVHLSEREGVCSGSEPPFLGVWKQMLLPSPEGHLSRCPLRSLWP